MVCAVLESLSRPRVPELRRRPPAQAHTTGRCAGAQPRPHDTRRLSRMLGAVRVTPSPLTVAVAQPEIVAGDLMRNAAAHAQAVRDAGARLVVFAELSLTGYEYNAASIAFDDPTLNPIIEACAETGSVALLGAPITEAGRDFIAMLRVEGAGVTVAARKVWLHGDEAERFTPASEVSTTQVDGWRVGLAICRDTSISQHALALSDEGIHLYVAGVLDVPGEESERAARSIVTARALGVPVAVAQYLGSTSLFPETGGTSAVYDSDGTVLAHTSDAGGVARAVVSLPVRATES